MTVAVAVAIGIIATLLVAGFGTILILVLLAMHRLQRAMIQAFSDFEALRSQIGSLDQHVDKIVSVMEAIREDFKVFRRDMQRSVQSSMMAAETVGKLNALLTGTAAPAAPAVPVTAYYPPPPPTMTGPRPGVPPNPAYEKEAPAEDKTDVVFMDDEQIAREQERQEAREQGFETDPDADFPIPIKGVGAEVS